MKRISGKLRILAFFTILMFLVSIPPFGAVTESFTSEWLQIDVEVQPAVFSYTFSGIGDSALLPWILGQNGIYGSILSTEVSDDAAVSLDENLCLTAMDHFDSVTVTVAIDHDRTVTIVLHNPEPDMPAGQTVTCTLGTFTAHDSVPAGTQLSVSAYTPADTDRAAVESEAKALLGEDAQISYLDISLAAPGGEVIHTGAWMTVRTDIALPAAEGAEGTPFLGGISVIHILENGGLEVLPATAAVEEGRIVSVTFDTPSCSGFAIAYTVDFEYGGFRFSMPGNGEILLSELFSMLGIGRSAADAAEVAFSDPSLVLVEREDGGWRLVSLTPFTSQETLRITMGDGTVFMIGVTDTQTSADLSNFLKNASITGAEQDEDGKYHVVPGREYGMTLLFREDTVYEFDNGRNLSYQLPVGMVIPSDTSGLLHIQVTEDGVTTDAPIPFTLTTDGWLTVYLASAAEQYPVLAEATNLSFRVSFRASFDRKENILHFSDSVERDLVFEDGGPGEAYAEKTAVYDESIGRFTYTVTVRSVGETQYVQVHDVITGDALIFNKDVTVSGNSGSYTISSQDNGFDCTFASMHDGETVTITYTADVNFDADTDGDGVITAQQTGNTVTVEPEGGDPHTATYSRTISFKPTSKSGGTESGLTEGGDKIINWTVTYNNPPLASAGGDTITDRIDASSADYMSYYGENVTVYKYNSAGRLVDTRTVPYADMTEHDSSHWVYTIPDTDVLPYRYEISYQTVVKMQQVNAGGTPVSLRNTANDSPGFVYVTPSEGAVLTKEVVSSSTEMIEWVSTIYVPAGGLSQAVFTDVFPYYWDSVTKQNYYDSYQEGSLVVEGLLEGEEYDAEDSGTELTVTFYKDSGRTQAGLQASSSEREITIRLKTKVNQDALQMGYERGPNDRTHMNIAKLNDTLWDSAYVNFDKTFLDKTATVTKDGFLYTLIISGTPEEPLVIHDTFDTSLMELGTGNTTQWNIDPNDRWIYGGNDYNPPYNIPMQDRKRVDYAATSDGMTLTAYTLPRQANGEPYSYYRITYYMKLKDGVSLEDLAIQQGGEFDLTNTARWGNFEDSFTYTTKYEYLDKKIIEDTTATNRKVKYQITFNPAKARLNNGQPMEMTDTLNEHLSVDYPSVTITTEPAGVPVPYSLKGAGAKTIATYMVPDETKVTVTYEALVVGTEKFSIVNTVEVNGRSKTVDEEKSFSAEGEGDAMLALLRISKVDGYDASKKLPGVRFRIFPEDQSLSFVEGQDVHEIFLETDADGVLTINGAKYKIFFNKKYYIEELEEPEGYGKLGQLYWFTLVSDMNAVNYPNQVYYGDGDSFQIKNWPLAGLVVEKQVTGSGDRTKDFRFRVSILNENETVNTDYNEKNGDDTFVNGTCEFTLKHNQQKSFWGFTSGTRYKVEELDADGYTVTVSYEDVTQTADENGDPVINKVTETINGTSHTGVTAAGYSKVIFTNDKGGTQTSISGTKELRGREMTESDRFTFVLEPADEIMDGSIYPGFPDSSNRLTTQNDASGHFSFTLDYDAEDYDRYKNGFTGIATLTYKLTEEEPSTVNPVTHIDPTTGIQYSQQTFWVQITLSMVDGELVVHPPKAYTQKPEDTPPNMLMLADNRMR